MAKTKDGVEYVKGMTLYYIAPSSAIEVEDVIRVSEQPGPIDPAFYYARHKAAQTAAINFYLERIFALMKLGNTTGFGYTSIIDGQQYMATLLGELK